LPLNAYRAAGLALTLTATGLSLATYVLLGVDPLLALWIGLAVVGASMALTPQELPPSKTLYQLVYGFEETITTLLELIGAHGNPIYMPADGRVLVCTAETPKACPRQPSLEARGEEIVATLLSPFSALVADLEPPCNPLDQLSALAEELGLAAYWECTSSREERMRLVCRVGRPKLASPPSMSVRLGSLYSALLATVAAKCLDKPVRLVRDEPIDKNSRIVEVEVL